VVKNTLPGGFPFEAMLNLVQPLCALEQGGEWDAVIKGGLQLQSYVL